MICRLLGPTPPQALILSVLGRARESAFPTSSQVMWDLLVPGPHLEER